MAVYTELTARDVRALVAHYAIGELEHFRGVSDGITNSTYFIDTTLGRWVLTIFEDLDAEALPFFMQLMDHLAGHGAPVSHPVARHDGGFLSTIRARPAALTHRLPGVSVATPTAEHCAALGHAIAEMHRAAKSFGQSQANARDLAWIGRTGETICPKLSADQRTLFDAELAAQRQACRTTFQGLSRTVIHADIFRDNVLFEAGRVSGVIDFYYACDEYTLYELAVICSDWAFNHAAHYDSARWAAFVDAYTRRCSLGAVEAEAWPAMLRAVALRFWASRLIDYHFPPPGQADQMHDPSPFEHLLVRYREQPPPLFES